MAMRIVYVKPGGRVGVLLPAEGFRLRGESDGDFAARLVAKDLPPDTEYAVVDEGDLPDRSTRDAWALVDGNVIVGVAPAGPVPESITRRQCALEMEARALISLQEADAMAADGTAPAFVAALFGQLGQEQQLRAQIDFRAGTYERANTLLGTLMALAGYDSGEADDFFRSAAAR